MKDTPDERYDSYLSEARSKGARLPILDMTRLCPVKQVTELKQFTTTYQS